MVSLANSLLYIFLRFFVFCGQLLNLVRPRISCPSLRTNWLRRNIPLHARLASLSVFPMKRLVWLLIAVFGTAFAQVSPVVSPFVQDEACCCCEGPAGTCGMPDCAPGPTTCQSGLTIQAPIVKRSEARKRSPAPRARYENFYVRFESRPALTPAWSASLTGAPTAPVPLFKAHCSFLI